MEKTADGEIVKMDRKGRSRTTPQRREALLEEFERSGMSGQQFAEWSGIKYSTFASWRSKQRKQAKMVSTTDQVGGTAPGVQWVGAVVGDGPSLRSKLTANTARALPVEFGSNVRLEISDEGQTRLAAMLLRELLGGARAC